MVVVDEDDKDDNLTQIEDTDIVDVNDIVTEIQETDIVDKNQIEEDGSVTSSML